MRVVLASDHAGYAMKKELAPYITSLGHEVTDIGTYSSESVHYPMYGRLAAEKVATGDADRAILVCGTGIGISLAANSVQGIRCVNCTEPYTALLSRQHNNTNAIALGGRVIGIEMAKMIIETWLAANFEGGQRHTMRVDMLTAMSDKPVPGAYSALEIS
ncbi:MAG: ribose 5-phosphate isomerase B [Defluviitaleaceae bacterium]|nr:ribose 5-phosphate isomerase B [Defluviitaleaceae bacterium]